MSRRSNQFIFWLLGAVVLTAAFLWTSSFVFPNWWAVSYDLAAIGKVSNLVASSTPAAPEVRHLATPKAVKALYMTQCAAASPSLRDHLIRLADETEINSIVVDLKDYSGAVVFDSSTKIAGGQGCTYSAFPELIKTLHEHNLYVIGRLTVFQDPLYTKTHPDQAVQSAASGGAWKDRKGLSFVDVSAKPYWDYVVKLAQEAYELGVDELNFDYVRYPSDGNMADTRFIKNGSSKAENLELFFKHLTSALPAPVLSADLFGMTTTNTDDLNIGQVLERALPYFDYVAPMVYPSHYPPQFNGWADPNKHPYDIVYFSLARAVARTVASTTPTISLAYQPIISATSSTSTPPLPKLYQKPAYSANKIRPWLQDFDYPVVYTSAMVRTQIQATYDAGLNSWMLWDPANQYTPSALQVEPQG